MADAAPRSLWEELIVQSARAEVASSRKINPRAKEDLPAMLLEHRNETRVLSKSVAERV
jgi:hypothetical protein